MAILYRQTDPYGLLVRDSLTFSGLPWSALEGRTLAESGPGRALLTVLEIQQRGFVREAVLGFVDASPTQQAGLPGTWPPWLRLSVASWPVRARSYPKLRRKCPMGASLRVVSNALLGGLATAAEDVLLILNS